MSKARQRCLLPETVPIGFPEFFLKRLYSDPDQGERSKANPGFVLQTDAAPRSALLEYSPPEKMPRNCPSYLIWSIFTRSRGLNSHHTKLSPKLIDRFPMIKGTVSPELSWELLYINPSGPLIKLKYYDGRKRVWRKRAFDWYIAMPILILLRQSL